MEERELTKRWGVTDDCAQCSYVPRGWSGVLDRLMAALAEIPGWDPKYVLQIKDKFGGLRFYYGLPSADGSLKDESLRANVTALIEQTEEEASHICAGCGSAEEVNTSPDERGWVRTECATCNQAR